MPVRHRDVVLAHFKELGLRLNVRKVCFSSTENLLSGRSVGSDPDAGTYVPCSDRVNSHVSQESKRRPVTHCQAVSKTAGSDVSCVQRDTFWPAVHETPIVVAQNQGVLPEGKRGSLLLSLREFLEASARQGPVEAGAEARGMDASP